MQFGIFCEIPVPRPWTAGKEREAYHHTLAQAVLADELGYHSFWTVEHHFLEEFSHCSAPGVLYGAVAARTRQIRIGHGVRLLPFPYNHPIRAAEAAAVVDLLSDAASSSAPGVRPRASSSRRSASTPIRRARSGRRRSRWWWAPGRRTSSSGAAGASTSRRAA